MSGLGFKETFRVAVITTAWFIFAFSLVPFVLLEDIYLYYKYKGDTR